MPTKGLIALSLVALFLVFSYEQDITRDVNDGPAPDANPDLRDFDIVQHTCALEVVLVLRGIEDHRMIDRLRDTAPIPLDEQPGGTMLACMPPPVEQVERPE
ncbi:MAG: hypothetical protein IPL52_06065 [Flavobacteriales bacterium]|nr:hypothetical protein [Flavobacteriales bacterium]